MCRPPDGQSSLNDWWLHARQTTPKPMRKGLASVTLLTDWMLWKQCTLACSMEIPPPSHSMLTELQLRLPCGPDQGCWPTCCHPNDLGCSLISVTQLVSHLLGGLYWTLLCNEKKREVCAFSQKKKNWYIRVVAPIYNYMVLLSFLQCMRHQLDVWLSSRFCRITQSSCRMFVLPWIMVLTS